MWGFFLLTSKHNFLCQFSEDPLPLSFSFRVGKTSIVKRCDRRQHCCSPPMTIGSDFITKQVNVRGKTFTFQVLIFLDHETHFYLNNIFMNDSLQIWDTCGQERFQSLGCAFYRETDVCLLVFDLSKSAEDFFQMDEWRKTMKVEGPEDYFCIVVGAKFDLIQQSKKRKIDPKIVQQYCNEHDFPYFETSAKENFGISQIFEFIAINFPTFQSRGRNIKSARRK